jgi:gas vesicle protein
MNGTPFIQGGSAMDNREMTCSGSTVALAFLGGAAAGVVADLLLAPESGEETRRAVKGYARRMAEDVLTKAKEVRAALDEAGREAMKENKENNGYML